jgi:hypothetical protein
MVKFDRFKSTGLCIDTKTLGLIFSGAGPNIFLQPPLRRPLVLVSLLAKTKKVLFFVQTVNCFVNS